MGFEVTHRKLELRTSNSFKGMTYDSKEKCLWLIHSKKEENGRLVRFNPDKSKLPRAKAVGIS